MLLPGIKLALDALDETLPSLDELLAAFPSPELLAELLAAKPEASR